MLINATMINFKIRLPASPRNVGNTGLIFSEEGSDLTIICRGREFKVHKHIICPKSDIISNKCKAKMREGRTGVMVHDEFDDHTVERMISWAYMGDYGVSLRHKGYLPLDGDFDTLGQDDGDIIIRPERMPDISTASSLINHARVHGLADYYQMADLRRYAGEQFDIECADVESSAKLINSSYVVEEVCQRSVSEESALRSAVTGLAKRFAYELCDDRPFLSALGDRERPELHPLAADKFTILLKANRNLRKVNKQEINRLERSHKAACDTSKAKSEEAELKAVFESFERKGNLKHCFLEGDLRPGDVNVAKTDPASGSFIGPTGKLFLESLVGSHEAAGSISVSLVQLMHWGTKCRMDISRSKIPFCISLARGPIPARVIAIHAKIS